MDTKDMKFEIVDEPKKELEDWRDAVLREEQQAWDSYMRTQGALSLIKNMIAERDKGKKPETEPETA